MGGGWASGEFLPRVGLSFVGGLVVDHRGGEAPLGAKGRAHRAQDSPRASRQKRTGSSGLSRHRHAGQTARAGERGETRGAVARNTTRQPTKKGGLCPQPLCPNGAGNDSTQRHWSWGLAGTGDDWSPPCWGRKERPTPCGGQTRPMGAMGSA